MFIARKLSILIKKPTKKHISERKLEIISESSEKTIKSCLRVAKNLKEFM